ncbi:hypothetical protein I546_1572 [Mycobacterium kansasii 732]|nr:hypothetical protein I546_1572 [Mycobacterium kansasii 732]
MPSHSPGRRAVTDVGLLFTGSPNTSRMIFGTMEPRYWLGADPTLSPRI